MLRTPLARNLYRQASGPGCLASCAAPPPRELYQCTLENLNTTLAQAWYPLACDEGCQEFVRLSCSEASAIFLQLLYSILLTLLSPFMSRTSINGLLGRGSMYILSTNQASRLFHQAGMPSTQQKFGSLLDVGAGDGEVTKHLAPLFHHVYATEQSPTMRWRLKRANFTVLEEDEWGDRMFDVVSCLNLLDRCSEPQTLLRRVRQSILPGGFLLVGMVFPLSQCVEKGPKMADATERLPACTSTHWEENVEKIVAEFFEPAGFQLRTLSRAPYLSKGDLSVSYYKLDEALFLFQTTSEENDASRTDQSSGMHADVTSPQSSFQV
ncbi:protein-L-histidine N-pros-methyltransferase-like [Sycon ciliatum]|uniref:protein-L-histidine N-pros-methyltransferase-like n=1 Tax=Sycon ciliatum TaxID=27933 RepID=UPI0020AB8E93|eukprot:scpid75898/ scgid3071/ Methyltransferase-like protein 9